MMWMAINEKKVIEVSDDPIKLLWGEVDDWNRWCF